MRSFLESIFEGHRLSDRRGCGSSRASTDDVLRANRSASVAALKDQSEALDLLEAACTIASNSLCAAAGIAPHAFNDWTNAVAPVTDAELASEVAKFNAETVQASAAALPLAERMSLVDQLLASNSAEIPNADATA